MFPLIDCIMYLINDIINLIRNTSYRNAYILN